MSRTIRNKAHKCYRNPKTLAERKAALAAKEDGLKVRPKRNAKNLPNSYDDLPVAASKEIIEIVGKMLDNRATVDSW